MLRMGRIWRIVFSSPSYAGAVAAVKAGLGITVMPNRMVPPELGVAESPDLPALSDTHVSLLKHRSDDPAINSLEQFVLKRLKY